MIHLETITPRLHEIAKRVTESLDSSYYLAGGTALALLSGHRESVDLDYFIQKHIDTGKLKSELMLLFPDISFPYEDVDTLWCTTSGVKVSFISRFAHCLDEVQNEEGFRLIGLKDIVVMKLNAVCGRDEYKDYYDLAILSDLTDVRQWTVWWEEVYPQSDSISWITALSHGDASEAVTLKGKTIHDRKEVVSMLEKVAKEVVSFL